MRDGFSGDFLLASDSGLKAPKGKGETHAEVLRSVHDPEGSKYTEAWCLQRLGYLIMNSLIDPTSKTKRKDTAQALAEAQNILTSYVLRNGISSDGRGSRALHQTPLLEHLHTAVANLVRSKDVEGTDTSEVIRDLFSPEFIGGVESMVEYVRTREAELASECMSLGTARGCEGRMFFRILGNSFLDSRHAVDAIELVYEAGDDHLPTRVHTMSLVQVKSPGFVLDNAASMQSHPVLLEPEKIAKKCAPLHNDHEKYVSTLTRFPTEALFGTRDITTSLALLDDEARNAGAMAGLFDARDAGFDLETAWSLVEESLPDSRILSTQGNVLYLESLRERILKIRDEQRALKGPSDVEAWYKPVLARIAERLRTAKAGLIKQATGGAGANTVGLRLPNEITSDVRIRDVLISTRTLAVPIRGEGTPALLFNPGTMKEAGQ